MPPNQPSPGCTAAIFGSQLGLFYDAPPQVSDENGETWISRGQNFVVAYSAGRPDGIFARKEQVDEYAVIIPDKETTVEVTTKDGTTIVPGYSVVFVPPGESRIRLVTAGTMVRPVHPEIPGHGRGSRQSGSLP